MSNKNFQVYARVPTAFRNVETISRFAAQSGVRILESYEHNDNSTATVLFSGPLEGISRLITGYVGIKWSEPTPEGEGE